MLQKPIIATQVTCTLMIHRGLRFRYEESDAHRVSRELGNVTADSEVTFEYGVRSADELNQFSGLEALPFQVQIHFTKLNGMKCLRVLSKSQPLTRDRAQAVQRAQVDMLCANVAQQAARMAEAGDYLQARMYNRAQGKLLKTSARDERSVRAVSKWAERMETFDDSMAATEARMQVRASAAPAALGAAAPAPAAAPGGVARAGLALPSMSAPARKSAARAERSDEDYAHVSKFKVMNSSDFQ